MHKLGPNGKAKEFVKYIMNIINMRLGRQPTICDTVIQ